MKKLRKKQYGRNLEVLITQTRYHHLIFQSIRGPSMEAEITLAKQPVVGLFSVGATSYFPHKVPMKPQKIHQIQYMHNFLTYKILK